MWRSRIKERLRMKKLLLITALIFLLGDSALKPDFTESSLGAGTAYDRFYSHYPPDPVNVRTGNFYLPIQDLFLPCFGIPLEVFRAYNSFSRQNGPFGIGWTFNYDIKITLGDFGTLKVLEPDGFLNEFKSASQMTEAKGEIIDKIINGKKEEDKQYFKKIREEDYYDKMRIKLATDIEFFKRLKTRYAPDETKEVSDGTYISTSRGTATIIKQKGTFTRIRQNGNKEYYNKTGDLTQIADRNGNGLKFTLDSAGKVTKVTDGCTHYILITYNNKGKIIQVADSLGRTFKYEYDKLDRMISSKGPDGNPVTYSYNKVGMMDKITYEKGESTEIAYDINRGTVTEQKGPGTKVTQYTYSSKGPNYKTATVKDNQGLFENYEFFDDERKTIQTDKNGKKVITVLSRTCSKPISVTDSKGTGESYKYDDAGNLIEKKDPSAQIVEYKYEPRFNQIEEIKDATGRKLKFLYDERGNLTYANLQDAGWVRIRYETHGKVQSLLDHNGNIISFEYNFFGKPTLIQKSFKDKKIGAILVKYDNTGEIVDIKYDPNNMKIVDEVKQTLGDILALLKPSGIDFQI